MPGYAEYLDVESAAKLAKNVLPEQNDTTKDSWKPVKEIADKLAENVDKLVAAATGTQKQKAKDLKEITDQLARAAGRAADGEADEGGLATTRGAIGALGDFLGGFDEAKLKAKKSVFSWG